MRAPFLLEDYAEHSARREVLALVCIGRACVREWAFHAQVATIREAPQPARPGAAYALAKLYADAPSRGHSVMTQMLLACAILSDGSPEPELAVALAVEEIGRRLLTSYARIVPGPLAPSGRQRYRPGQATVEAFGEGAELSARRGAGLCLWPGCDAECANAEVKGAVVMRAIREGPKYCVDHPPARHDHHQDDRDEKERQAKLIERVRDAAAECLPMLEEQVRWLTESSTGSVRGQTFDLPRLARRPRAWHTSRAVGYPRTGFNVDWRSVSHAR